MQRFALAVLRGVAERGARAGWAGTPAGPLRFAVRGRPGPLPPLLVLHGLGDSLAGWAQVAGALARRRELHLLDLPGHGLSGDPPDWRLSTLAAAVAHYARGLPAPVVVGHSLGGWLALRLAASLPLSGLVLVNPAGAPMEWGQFRALISATDRAGVGRYLHAAWHRPPFALRLLPDEVIAAMWTRATRGVIDALSPADFLRAEDLRGLPVPARIVWGEADRLLPPGSLDFFAAALPRAEIVRLPRCGHLPHFEAPRALAQALLRPLTPAA